MQWACVCVWGGGGRHRDPMTLGNMEGGGGSSDKGEIWRGGGVYHGGGTMTDRANDDKIGENISGGTKLNGI